MDIVEIKDTLKAANEYLVSLENLNSELQQAEQQIQLTASESTKNVEVIFTTLLEKITSALTKRKMKLLSQISKIHLEGITPLQECRNVVCEKISSTSLLIQTGVQLTTTRNAKDLEDFNNKSRLLGSLPEVPDLKEVPYVYFQFEPTLEKEIVDICSNFGSISKIAPVQISSTTERPGAILVEWRATDFDDRSCDIQEFRLQKAYGNVIGDHLLEQNFHDCYIGTENQHLVKQLQSHQEYSFRVCCKYEGSALWSQWSLSQIASTKIPRFSWKQSPGFQITNDNTIAKLEEVGPKILCSNGPQFNIGYSVEFTFLEVDFNRAEMYVGLTTSKEEESIDKIVSNSFILEANGDIIINGLVKSTKLPEIKKSSKISFTCETSSDDKLRINVDSNDKRVTYDWTVESNMGIFFFSHFTSNKWKIMVE